MLYQINISKILFIDVETVPVSESYDSLPDRLRQHWDKKAKYLSRSESDTPESLFSQAGIYAEFGKIVCISAGFFKNGEFRMKSFAGSHEPALLESFAKMLDDYFSRGDSLLCAHNGKEFDYPYIARRMLINGIRLPAILNLAGKKPWEVMHLDTLDLWKFGDYKHYTSLDLLATVFDIPTPKEDMDGSMVADVYYKENDLKKIIAYCQKDVVTLTGLFLRYLGNPALTDEQVVVSPAEVFSEE